MDYPEYLIHPMSLREPSDSHCQVVRAADNVRLYVGTREGCLAYINRVEDYALGRPEDSMEQYVKDCRAE